MKTRKLLTAVIAFLAFAVTTLAQTVPSYVPTNGLVGYWGFNGNANDQSGNGNNGTVNGATLTTDRNGNANSAYSFDGVSSNINVPYSSSFNFNGAQTITFWIYRVDYASNSSKNTIISRYNGFDIWSDVLTNNIYYDFIQGDGTLYSCGTPPANYNMNEWKQYCIINDASSIKIYKNGVFQIQNTIGNPLTVIANGPVGGMLFGKEISPFIGDGGFKGKIDDIAIYNRALSTLEITQLYTSALSVQTLCTKTIQPYNVNVGDATHDGSTYAWSISPATPNAVISGNGTNAITIDWTNAPDGTYALQAIETNASGCVSTAVSASINLSTTPTAPVAPATQTFCTASTVANLTATGTNLQWYDVATGGTALASTTALVSGTTYYVSQTTSTCESTRTAVAVTVTPLTAPTAVAQTFCTSATVANLVATGTAIKWYATLTGGTALATTTALVTGTTYYASQTVGTCESTRTAVAVTITPKTTPTFTQVAPICAGATLAALPTTSTNGVTGTWSPAINNTITTTYTFTPTAGLCANTATMTITVNPIVTPTFTAVASSCANATLTALPTTSNNGISGTWSPAINNTTTTTYTFTPTVGQCANTTTQTITITAPKVTSAISFIAPVAALPSVTIGTQVWTNKNLDVTTYRDGTPIPQVTDPTAWANLTTGAWCYYNNDPANGAIYGKLYNWYAAVGIYDTASLNNPSLRKQFAPIGWHVPSDGEWTTLGLSLGGDAVAGGKMKESGFSHWATINTAATNVSGFTGLPGGYIYSNGLPYAINTLGCWWSSTSGVYRRLFSNTGELGTDGYWLGGGFSIRLVKD